MRNPIQILDRGGNWDRDIEIRRASLWVFGGVTLAAATSSVPLLESGLGSRLIVGDLILIATISFAGLADGSRPFLGPVVKWASFVLALSFVVVCGSQLFIQSGWFSLTEMFLSSAKLLLYASAADWFSRYLLRYSFPPQVIRTLLGACAVATGIQFGISTRWVPALPYIEDPTLKWDRFSDLPRLYGFFSEPSTAAIFYLAIIFALLQAAEKDRVAIALALPMILVTFSMSALAIGMLMSVGWLVSGNARISTVVKGSAAAVVLLSVGSQIAFLRAAVEARVVERVVGAKSDASTVSRVLDSWEAAIRFNPLRVVGIGPGQFSLALRDAAEVQLDGIDDRIVGAGGAWNIYANVFVEFGIIGVATLIGLKYFYVKGPVANLLIYGCSFATGVIFGWLFWFVFCIAAHVRTTSIAADETEEDIIDLTETLELPLQLATEATVE